MIENKKGFTIVELLIVIVVIGILAAISIVAYNGISDKARESRVLQDLANASKKVEMFHAEKGAYPATIDEAKSLNVKFSTSPIGSNAIYCGNASGYAIKVRDNAKVYLAMKGTSPKLESNSWNTSGSPNCAESSSYPPIAWGTFWVDGG